MKGPTGGSSPTRSVVFQFASHRRGWAKKKRSVGWRGAALPAQDDREYPAVLVDRVAALSVSAGSASIMGDRMGDRSRSVLKPHPLFVDLLDFPRRRWPILAETVPALSAESDQKTESRPSRVAFKRTTYRSVDRRNYGGGWRREWDCCGRPGRRP